MMETIPEMETVIATVSGYHGTERFKLIKLISYTGASYIGALAKSTTHLVCWQFEGKKYNLAKSFGIHMVSHRWFEDCLKEGKRLPEGPYTLQCGLQSGPILWEIPVVHAKKGHSKSSKRKFLADNSNTMLTSGEANVGLSLPDVGHLKCPIIDLSKEVDDSSYLHSLHPTRRKESIGDVKNSSLSESSRKRCRKTETALSSEDFNNVILDHRERDSQRESSREKSASNGACTLEANNNLSIELNCSRNLSSIPLNGITSANSQAELVKERNGPCKNENNQNEKIEDGNDQIQKTNIETSFEVSCAICWTEFCSSRGVLSCGHRFCYACIHEWANCQASKGKISTCPLCKASFTSITKVEACATFDQKVYSQTIPCGSLGEDAFSFLGRENISGIRVTSETVCYECHNHEPEDLLVSCHICHDRWVHSYCLDPPLVPWTCLHCRDLRMLYQRFR